jgi:hypothetical protein
MLIFKTKKDTSNNIYYLILDIKNNTYKIDYNLGVFTLDRFGVDPVTLANKKALNALQKTLDKQGFTQTF